MSIKAVHFLCQLTKQLNTMITIQEFIQREILVCVSCLIDELRKKEGCLEEEIIYDLYKGPIDYGAAKYELELERDSVFKHFCPEDNKYYFGVRSEHFVWRIDPIYNDEEQAIAEWFEIYHGGDLEDYRQEIFEHYIVTNWLADKLKEQGETVVRDVFGLTIYCRPCTGQALHCDYVIQTIYDEMISKIDI